jgi:hypothetical protein
MSPLARVGRSLCVQRPLNRDEAGKACYSRFSAGLVIFGNYFSRVGECESQGGIDGLISDR